jgi:hypothetical protein
MFRLGIYSIRNKVMPWTDSESHWVGGRLQIIKLRRMSDPRYDHLYLCVSRWGIITVTWWAMTFLVIALFGTICIMFFQ